MKKLLKTTLPALLMVISVGAQNPANPVNPYPKTIAVSGSATMEIVPDEIYVLVDLKEYEKKGVGKVSLESIKSSFLSSCRSTGIPDSAISIASYDGYANYWQRKKHKKEELYASITYLVKFSRSQDMDKLVERLDDNATENFRIASTSHSKIEEYRKQLKIEAIRAAREKAAYLAAAIGEQVGVAVTITEPGEYGVPFYRFANAALSNTALASTGGVGFDQQGAENVDFKKIDLRYEINVVFALQ